MRQLTCFALALTALGCGTDPQAPTGAGPPGKTDNSGNTGEPGDPLPSPSLSPPADCDAAPDVQQVWDHDFTSPLVTALGSPYHGAADTVNRVGDSAVFRARFVYGLVLKDLEDETILGYIETGDCQWKSLGDAITDDDGVATFAIPADLLMEPGAYNVELVVRGDDTRVRGSVWVIGEGTDMVVFDIDGTLTTGDGELLEELLLGSEPEMYAAANEVVWRYVEAGYFPIYLTGRPVYADIMTRNWLEAMSLPAGPLHMTSGLTEGAFEVERYKLDVIDDLGERVGADVPFAYGNASTDICAYARAGIDPAATYIIGDNRGNACDGFPATNAVLDYPTHLEDLAPPQADNRN